MDEEKQSLISAETQLMDSYLDINKNDYNKNVLNDNYQNIFNTYGKNMINNYGRTQLNSILNDYGKSIINDYNKDIVNKNGQNILNDNGLILIDDYVHRIINENGKNILSRYGKSIIQQHKTHNKHGKKSIINDFDTLFKHVRQLVYYVISDTLLIGFIIVGLVGTVGILKNDSYPIDLKSNYYINKSHNCDLTDIKEDKFSYCTKLNITFNEEIKSSFSKDLIEHAKTGSESSGILGNLLFLLFYLLFYTEYFLMNLLNIINNSLKPYANNEYYMLWVCASLFIYILVIINNRLTPLILKKIKIRDTKTDTSKIDTADFYYLPLNVGIYILSTLVLLFLVCLISSSIYFIFLVASTLTKNMSIQINIFLIFLIYMVFHTTLRIINIFT